MLLISHRGNINGSNPERENSPSYIDEALNLGYDVEIDVWYDRRFWLGHDEPKYKLKLNQLVTEQGRIWVHCKNLKALHYLASRDERGSFPNFFWHENDAFTLTNRGYIWTFPGQPLTSVSICVLPEKTRYSKKELRTCYGICTDNPSNYK